MPVKPVKSNLKGEFSQSGLKTGGLMTKTELTDSEWRPLPATPLPGRNAIRIQNQSGVLMYMNYDDSAPAGEGIEVAADDSEMKDITDTVLIYGRLVSGGGTKSVMVEEIA